MNTSRNTTINQFTLVRDTFTTAFVKNLIVVLIWLGVSHINSLLVITFYRYQIFYLNPRYILFIHLVLNDMIQLTTTVVLFVTSYIFFRINACLCCFILILAIFTTLNMPLNLAVMAVECYISVCLPLRHSQFCTTRRTYIVIGGIWALSALSALSDLFIFVATGTMQLFNSVVFCTPDGLFQHQFHKYRKDTYFIYLISVWLTLFYSYFMIFTAAKSAQADAKKARNTVLLHGFQLLLAMLTFLAPTIKKSLISWFPRHNFHVLFVCYIIIQILPRLISPIVYGLRDKTFRLHLKKVYTVYDEYQKPCCFCGKTAKVHLQAAFE